MRFHNIADRNWIPTKAWTQVVGVGRRTKDDARPTASGRRGRARGRRQVGLRGLWRRKWRRLPRYSTRGATVPRVLFTGWRLGFGGLPAPWGKPSDMIALAWLDWYIYSPYIERFTWPLSKRLINPNGLGPNRPLTPLTLISFYKPTNLWKQLKYLKKQISTTSATAALIRDHQRRLRRLGRMGRLGLAHNNMFIPWWVEKEQSTMNSKYADFQ